MTAPLFYQRIVLLDRAQHGNLKLRPLGSMTFAAETALVPLLSDEFVQASREYPIAFMRDEQQNLLPVALTGVPGGSNVYVDAAGQWQARYLPAYVRRYPFIFAQTGVDQLSVCFDAECEALDTSEGLSLFEEDGAAGPALEPVLDLLAEYQRQALVTHAFMKRLDASGLMMEAHAKADLADGRSLALQGFWVVDEARLKELPEATARQWLATGELGLVYAHLLSLGNLLELVRRGARPGLAPVSESTGANSDRLAARRETRVAAEVAV